MRTLNVASCVPDEVLERGEFAYGAFQLGERLRASVVGATVYEIQAGDRMGPYHYHHGVEEWMYVVAGAPVLRDADGERALEPGTLVAFDAGPAGAHSVRGPGRIVMFSAGAYGWGEAFVTVYLDSDKVGAAPGVMFRRGDALESWAEIAEEAPERQNRALGRTAGQASPLVNLSSAPMERPPGDPPGEESGDRGMALRAWLGSTTWAATLYELAPGEASSPYHYVWCREKWALVVSGAPTLRHGAGEDALAPGDMVCFPGGPDGAHQFINQGDGPVRLVTFSAPVGRPTSAFYPDDGTVVIRVPGHEGFRFREADQVDYWDSEPGAGSG